jgi:quinoprotein glucose dehydrogenase
MTTGDKAWWTSNGEMLPVKSDHPLFAGVTLPSQGGRGQAQAITTKTLLIYGTGRSGGDPENPKLYAVDKKTGKQVGALAIPSRTTAVPMTLLHQGKQYIVFATGAGANTSLVGLTLPEDANGNR